MSPAALEYGAARAYIGRGSWRPTGEEAWRRIVGGLYWKRIHPRGVYMARLYIGRAMLRVAVSRERPYFSAVLLWQDEP